MLRLKNRGTLNLNQTSMIIKFGILRKEKFLLDIKIRIYI